MCDYSLEAIQSRPARTGERLVARVFSSGSVGLAAPGIGTPEVAVCLCEGTRLRLTGLYDELSHHGATVDVEFVQIDHLHPYYRDAFVFPDKHAALLQWLEGVDVEVLSLPEEEGHLEEDPEGDGRLLAMVQRVPTRVSVGLAALALMSLSFLGLNFI